MNPPIPLTESKNALEPRQFLKDLATPPEVAEACVAMKPRSPAARHRIEEELMLQYYYGGRDVACLDMPDGFVVLSVGTPFVTNLPEVMNSLSSAERAKLCILTPEPWDQSVSSPSLFFDAT